MPVSPLGNINYINQNMAYPATQASNELAKEGFAATLNMAEFNEKEKTLNKLEKVNEIHEIKEEIKEKSEQEKKKKHNQEAKTNDDEKNEEDESKDPNFKDAQSIHRLDMSI
ncbi:hypothetical protein Q8V47_000008 [Campylobacter jejuni]|uniref:Coiled-coil protein n=1 Tax=Campylobacter jejuni TaxID=197 RepID=A0A5T0NDL2_CAMJU|nr:hypothetical protein [Campylobacter jejuni]EAH6307345.1 hypothetical protein [Campylobacter jejuni]EAH7752739.1 hypothetical protein [Campylobacter jejuni]EAH8751378.1 hypothetical protein [Campylobacter jejuni]EAI3785603.1 hypothetical protein [Campylobacter jejuni]EAI4463949.1 hypothetical protein [Campylobacter jejuni]